VACIPACNRRYDGNGPQSTHGIPPLLCRHGDESACRRFKLDAAGCGEGRWHVGLRFVQYYIEKEHVLCLSLSLPPSSLSPSLSISRTCACTVFSLARSPSLSLLLQPGLESGESRLPKVLCYMYETGPDCFLLARKQGDGD
jgi:hypothetical protein